MRCVAALLTKAALESSRVTHSVAESPTLLPYLQFWIEANAYKGLFKEASTAVIPEDEATSTDMACGDGRNKTMGQAIWDRFIKDDAEDW